MVRGGWVQEAWQDARVKVLLAAVLSLSFLMVALAAGLARADVPADLELKKTPLATPIASGEALDYRISVKNIGAGPATNVVINDLLPAGFSWFQGAPQRSECVIFPFGDRQRLKCEVALINPGGAFVVRVKALTGRFCGEVSNTATTRSDKEPAFLEGNNTATGVITVLCPS